MNFELGTYMVEMGNRDHKIWKKYINDGDVIFDVGTHEGMHAVLFANDFPNSKIHCFDPMYELVKEQWIRHFEINKLETKDRVLFHPIGFSDRKASLTFKMPSSDPDEDNGVYSYNAFDEKLHTEMDLIGRIGKLPRGGNVIRMDSFCKENNVNPDILKIDVEGAEYDVLVGAGKLLENVKSIFIEYCWGGAKNDFRQVISIKCDDLLKTFDFKHVESSGSSGHPINRIYTR